MLASASWVWQLTRCAFVHFFAAWATSFMMFHSVGLPGCGGHFRGWFGLRVTCCDGEERRRRCFDSFVMVDGSGVILDCLQIWSLRGVAHLGCVSAEVLDLGGPVLFLWYACDMLQVQERLCHHATFVCVHTPSLLSPYYKADPSLANSSPARSRTPRFWYISSFLWSSPNTGLVPFRLTYGDFVILFRSDRGSFSWGFQPFLILGSDQEALWDALLEACLPQDLFLARALASVGFWVRLR